MIRNATHDDIPRILELGAMMHMESRFSVLKYNAGKVAVMCRHLINTDQFSEVVEKDGVIVGGFIGFVTEHWASSDLIACDCGLFIDPRYRGARDGIRLAKRFKEWAIGKGAKMVTLGINTGVNPENTLKMLETCGYEKCGYLVEGVKECVPV